MCKIDDYIMSVWLKNQSLGKWKTIETDIDFKKYEPISTDKTSYYCDEIYEIDDNTYRLWYGYMEDIPLIEILIK